MNCIPEPAADAIPVNDPATTDVGPGQRATFTFTAATRTNNGFYLPVLAASKRSQTSYEVKLDGVNIYGPAAVPPTDIDDTAICFLPAFEFSQKIEVVIINMGDSTREYTVQPIGFKEGANGA